MDTFAFQYETIQNAAQTPAARTQRERQPISEPCAASCGSGLSQSERSARRRVFCELAVGGFDGNTQLPKRVKICKLWRQRANTFETYINKKNNCIAKLVKVM